MKKIGLYGFMLILLANLIVAITDVDLTINLTNYYSFDDGSAVSLTGNRNGTITGDVFNYPNGKQGNAFNFSGGVIQLNNFPPFNGTKTISVWVRPNFNNDNNTILGTGSAWMGIISGRHPGAGGWGETNKYHVWMNVGGSYKWINSSTTIDTADFVNIVFRWNDSMEYIFIDGVLEGNRSTTDITEFEDFYLGSNSGSDYKFDGVIDEVGFWNMSLNDTAITQLYRRISPYNLTSYNVSLPAFVAPTPPDGAINNTLTHLVGSTTKINVSCGGNNIDLWFDTNDPPTTLRLNNQSTPTYWNLAGLSEAKYYYMTRCFNASKNEHSDYTSVRTFTYDLTPPRINTSISDNLTFVITKNLTFTINYSDNFKVKWFNVSVDSISINRTDWITTSFFSGNFTYDTSGYSYGLHNTTSVVCDYAINCYNVTYKFYQIGVNLSYDQNVVNQEQVNHKLILNMTNVTNIPTINAVLVYNNTKYRATQANGVEKATLTANLTTPNAVANISFFWEFNITDDVFNTSVYSQSIHLLGISFCNDEYSIVTLNITSYDENSPSLRMLTNITLDLYIYGNATAKVNYSFVNYSTNNMTICLKENTNFYLDALIKHQSPNGFNERYYIERLVLSNISYDVFLYNFASTTGISTLNGIIKNESYRIWPNVVAKMQRYYPSEQLWRTVQIDKSDEYGNVIFYVIEKTEDYKFIFDQNAIYLDSTNPVKFICTNSLCTQTFIIRPVQAESVKWTGFTGIYSYNNNTGIISYTYSDSRNVVQSIWMSVTKQTMGGSTTICNQSLSTVSGTLICDISGETGIFFVNVYRSGSPYTAIVQEIIEKVYDTLASALDGQGYKNDGILYSGLLMIGIIGLGAITPIGALFMGAFAFVILFQLGMATAFTLTLISSGIAVSLLLSYIISRWD